MGSTPIYNIPFAEPSDLVRDWPSISEQVALAVEAALEDIPVREKRIAAFTGSGTWTVPAGVTYAIAHMLGGGGGIGEGTTAGSGSASSVAFAGGTVSANGGLRAATRAGGTIGAALAGAANTGRGGIASNEQSSESFEGGASTYVVAANTVTPAATVAVVVGAGGTAGTNGAAGGSGYVYIEYYEEV
jgi:hypothetical protein